MIYESLYKVSGSLGGWGREDYYAETEEQAILKAQEFIDDYDQMKEGVWRKKSVSGAFVTILHLPSRKFIARYSQVESGKWIVDDTPLTDPVQARWPRR